MGELFSLTESYLEKAAQVLSRAFAEEPLWEDLRRRSTQAEAVIYELFALMVRYGLTYGEVHAPTEAIEGVAIWLPSQRAHMTWWRVIRCGGLSLLRYLDVGTIQRYFIDDTQIQVARRHYAPFPHWYLAALGVEPSLRGRGHARTLLTAMLARLDDMGMPAYLETHTFRNVAMYERYGFRVVVEDVLRHTRLRYWGMLRFPAADPPARGCARR